MRAAPAPPSLCAGSQPVCLGRHAFVFSPTFCASTVFTLSCSQAYLLPAGAAQACSRRCSAAGPPLLAQPLDADLLPRGLAVQGPIEAALQQRQVWSEAVSALGANGREAAPAGGLQAAQRCAPPGKQAAHRAPARAASLAQPSVHVLARAAGALDIHRPRVVVLLALGGIEALGGRQGGRGGAAGSARSGRGGPAAGIASWPNPMPALRCSTAVSGMQSTQPNAAKTAHKGDAHLLHHHYFLRRQLRIQRQRAAAAAARLPPLLAAAAGGALSIHGRRQAVTR